MGHTLTVEDENDDFVLITRDLDTVNCYSVVCTLDQDKSSCYNDGLTYADALIRMGGHINL